MPPDAAARLRRRSPEPFASQLGWASVQDRETLLRYDVIRRAVWRKDMALWKFSLCSE